MTDYYTDSESDAGDDYEMCLSPSNSCALPFDPTSIENIILSISDKFDFRVIMRDDRTKGALLVTAGLTLAGGLIGRQYGGKVGAAVGGAVGGVCGLGVVAVSMRDIWQDIKAQLHDLMEIVYDYLAGLGLEDYKRAAMFLTSNSSVSTQLAMLILETTSSVIGKKVLSSLTAA